MMAAHLICVASPYYGPTALWDQCVREVTRDLSEFVQHKSPTTTRSTCVTMVAVCVVSHLAVFIPCCVSKGVGGRECSRRVSGYRHPSRSVSSVVFLASSGRPVRHSPAGSGGSVFFFHVPHWWIEYEEGRTPRPRVNNRTTGQRRIILSAHLYLWPTPLVWASAISLCAQA